MIAGGSGAAALCTHTGASRHCCRYAMHTSQLCTSPAAAAACVQLCGRARGGGRAVHDVAGAGHGNRVCAGASSAAVRARQSRSRREADGAASCVAGGPVEVRANLRQASVRHATTGLLHRRAHEHLKPCCCAGAALDRIRSLSFHCGKSGGLRHNACVWCATRWRVCSAFFCTNRIHRPTR